MYCFTGGHFDLVKYFVKDCGADIGALTTIGGSPLWWAKKVLDPIHPVVKFLEEVGAPEIATDPRVKL